MDRPDDMADGVWQHKASWRSPSGQLTMALLFFAALPLLLAAATGGYIFWGSIALFLAWLAWVVGRPLFNGDWVLRIGPRGVSGSMLKNRTIPWRDLRDVAVETVHGHQLVVLTLAPEATESLAKTKRWASGRKPERRIALGMLPKAVVPEAILALHKTFALRGGASAEAAAQAREHEARLEAAFEEELARNTKTTWALYLVVGLNVGVWVLGVAGGMSPIRPGAPDLFRSGAISAWAVVREHEYWRMLAGTFLHGGLVHLAMNMLGLWGAGKLLNRLYGNAQFLLLYLLAALAGASASLHFGAQTAVSVGASGAVFGVLTALLVAVRKHRDQVPKALVKQLMGSEAVFLIYALFNGFARQGIDNAAHVGGLVAGAAMGWVLAGAVPGAKRGSPWARAAAVAAALLAAVGAMVATTPSPRVDHRAMFAAADQLQKLVPRGQAVHAALQKDANAAKAGTMSPEQLVQAVEAVHLPALRRLHAELAAVPRAQGSPLNEVAVDMQQMTAAVAEGLELEVRAARGQGRSEDQARGETLKREIQLASRRLQDRLAALKAKKKA